MTLRLIQLFATDKSDRQYCKPTRSFDFIFVLNPQNFAAEEKKEFGWVFLKNLKEKSVVQSIVLELHKGIVLGILRKLLEQLVVHHLLLVQLPTSRTNPASMHCYF